MTSKADITPESHSYTPSMLTYADDVNRTVHFMQDTYFEVVEDVTKNIVLPSGEYCKEYPGGVTVDELVIRKGSRFEKTNSSELTVDLDASSSQRLTLHGNWAWLADPKAYSWAEKIRIGSATYFPQTGLNYLGRVLGTEVLTEWNDTSTRAGLNIKRAQLGKPQYKSWSGYNDLISKESGWRCLETTNWAVQEKYGAEAKQIVVRNGSVWKHAPGNIMLQGEWALHPIISTVDLTHSMSGATAIRWSGVTTWRDENAIKKWNHTDTSPVQTAAFYHLRMSRCLTDGEYEAARLKRMVLWKQLSISEVRKRYLKRKENFQKQPAPAKDTPLHRETRGQKNTRRKLDTPLVDERETRLQRKTRLQTLVPKASVSQGSKASQVIDSSNTKEIKESHEMELCLREIRSLNKHIWWTQQSLQFGIEVSRSNAGKMEALLIADKREAEFQNLSVEEREGWRVRDQTMAWGTFRYLAIFPRKSQPLTK